MSSRSTVLPWSGQSERGTLPALAILVVRENGENGENGESGCAAQMHYAAPPRWIRKGHNAAPYALTGTHLLYRVTARMRERMSFQEIEAWIERSAPL